MKNSAEKKRKKIVQFVETNCNTLSKKNGFLLPKTLENYKTTKDNSSDSKFEKKELATKTTAINLSQINSIETKAHNKQPVKKITKEECTIKRYF